MSNVTFNLIFAFVRFLLYLHSPVKSIIAIVAKISVMSRIGLGLKYVILLAFFNKNTVGQRGSGFLLPPNELQADKKGIIAAIKHQRCQEDTDLSVWVPKNKEYTG